MILALRATMFRVAGPVDSQTCSTISFATLPSLAKSRRLCRKLQKVSRWKLPNISGPDIDSTLVGACSQDTRKRDAPISRNRHRDAARVRADFPAFFGLGLEDSHVPKFLACTVCMRAYSASLLG